MCSRNGKRTCRSPHLKDGAMVKDIEEYVELDSFQVQDLIVNDNKGNLVVAKVSQCKVLPHGVKGDGKANQLCKTMKLIMKTNPPLVMVKRQVEFLRNMSTLDSERSH